MNPRVRDFSTVVARLETVRRNGWRVEKVAEVWGYPFLTASRLAGRKLPTVYLTSGMHGEEPAGVEAILRWLESGKWKRWPVNWFVIPCINPYGWERNQRRNRQNRDINRHFRSRSNVAEAELIKNLVRGRRFLMSMEFHEDVGATGFYFYEGRRQGPYVGERVVAAVSRVVHINRDPVIDGHRATAEGLIRRDLGSIAVRRRRQWPMAYHLYRRCTDNIFGSETPVIFPLEKRARAHLVALETVLEFLVSAG